MFMSSINFSRTILHCDLNNFFASVEGILNPDLKPPFAVCGDPETRTGIVLAKCELAKSFGVKTGEPIWQARKKCPNLSIVPPRHGVYSKYSQKVRDIYARYTDLVESFGIDECWLDVTASEKLFGDGMQIANRIMKEVKTELGLGLSIGIAWNKSYAKIASDIAPPSGILHITRENYASKILTLSVNSLLYVGRKSNAYFAKLGIKTVGDLANYDPELLKHKLGITAKKIIKSARGEDYSPVENITYKDDPKSVGNGITLPQDISAIREVVQVLYVLSEEVATRMRRKNVRGTTISLSVRRPDLSWIGAQKTITAPTHNAQTIARTALEILPSLQPVNGDSTSPIRALRIAVSNLEKDTMAQIDLFDALTEHAAQKYNKKQDALSALFDDIRKKHGKSKITFGHGIGGVIDITEFSDENTSDPFGNKA